MEGSHRGDPGGVETQEMIRKESENAGSPNANIFKVVRGPV
jgi:hypothetical protein